MNESQYYDIKDRLTQVHELCMQMLTSDSKCTQKCRWPLLTANNNIQLALNAIDRSYEKHQKE